MKGRSGVIIRQCLFVLFLLAPYALCEQYPFCEDTEQEFEITTTSGQHSTVNCEWVKSNPEECALEDMEKHCPSTCNLCECTNNPASFTVKSDSFVGGRSSKTCSWAVENPRERCGSDFNGTIENCPLYCGKCERKFDSRIH